MIHALNSLRGAAALIVVLAHYSKSSMLFGGLTGRGAGQLGVMLFFLISGFLMAHLYLEDPFNKKEIKKYISARFARIFPLVFVILSLSYISFWFIEDRVVLYNIQTFGRYLSHILLLEGKSVFWTIPPEVHFYFIFILFWFLFQFNKSLSVVAGLLTFWFIYTYNFPSYSGSIVDIRYHFQIFKVLHYFLMGMFLGWLYNQLNINEKFKKNWFVVLILFIPILFPQIFEIIFGLTHDIWRDIRVFITLSFVFFVLVFLVPEKNKLLNNKIGDFIGKISFSVYLLHMPILKFFKPYSASSPMFYFIIFTTCVILASFLSFKFIENPSRKYFNEILS